MRRKTAGLFEVIFTPLTPWKTFKSHQTILAALKYKVSCKLMDSRCQQISGCYGRFQYGRQQGPKLLDKTRL